MKSTETLTLTKEEVEEAIRDYVHDRRGWRPEHVNFICTNINASDEQKLVALIDITPRLVAANVQRSLDGEEEIEGKTPDPPERDITTTMLRQKLWKQDTDDECRWSWSINNHLSFLLSKSQSGRGWRWDLELEGRQTHGTDCVYLGEVTSMEALYHLVATMWANFK